MSILDKARAGHNALERIMNAIPGFKGYRDKELRRDTDRIEREHFASQLEECKKTLNNWAAEASRKGALDAINGIETARKRLEKVVARIRFADRGYAGFFDAVKVDEAALERVYAFDLDLITGVESVREAATGGWDAAAELTNRIDALDARLAEREALLNGIK
jgi:hypothetical protein